MKLNSVLGKTFFKLLMGWLIFSLLFNLFTRQSESQSWGVSIYLGNEFGFFITFVKALLKKVIITALIIYVVQLNLFLLGKTPFKGKH